MLVLCCLKLGGARGQAERGELVFLQVPGFKKLQAFLHSQAFLQTLGETKDRQRRTRAGGRWRASGTQKRRDAQAKETWAAGASLAERLVGHAKRKHTVMEGGYW